MTASKPNHEPRDDAEEPRGQEAGSPSDGPAAASEAAGAEAAPRDYEAEIAELKDRALRALAEAENTRRRGEREKSEAQKFGIARFARDVLSVADNLRRAMESLPAAEREAATEPVKNLLLGIEMTERELHAVLERHGVRALKPKGERFDPNLHQAVAEVPGSGQPPGTVVDVFQTGYVIEDRLLRPAMVTVAKAEGPVPPAGDGATPGSSVDTKA
ncbi:MAG: nucleotide exchange factor GrpE [Alphaproteobacteria bacterium]|nr:nucleotide exchange factor GrpE [Alphaproteobacteria bacterium]